MNFIKKHLGLISLALTAAAWLFEASVSEKKNQEFVSEMIDTKLDERLGK